MTFTTALVKIAATALVTVSFIAVSPTLADTGTLEEPIALAATTTTPIIVATSTPKKVIKHTTVQGDCTAYKDIISKYDWPVDVAMQICKDESHGYAANVNTNPSETHYADAAHTKVLCVGSLGLFQIGCFWPASLGFTKADLTDPEKNIAMAYEIWVKQGFYPWSTYHPKS